MDQEVQSVRCAQCGAKLRVKSSTTSFRCPQCQHPGRVQRGEMNDPVATSPPDKSATRIEPVRVEVAPAVTSSSATPEPSKPTSRETNTSTISPDALPINIEPETPAVKPRKKLTIDRGFLGTIVGATLILGLIYVRPIVGLAGVVGGLGISVALLASVVFTKLALADSLAKSLGESHEDVISARKKSQVFKRFATAVIATSGCLFLVDSLGVEGEGRLQGFLPRIEGDPIAYRRVPESSVKQEPAIPPIDEKPWSSADYVIVSPANEAVALSRQRQDGRATFAVLARSKKSETPQALSAAWDHQRTILDANGGIAQLLNDPAQPGEILSPITTNRLTESLKPLRFTPENAQLVRFHDLRQGKLRVGHLVQQLNETFQFSELIPMRGEKRGVLDPGRDVPYKTEFVQEKMIQPGTLQILQGESDLRGSVDFLDYCVFRVLQTLDSNADLPPTLFVDHVATDSQLVDSIRGGQSRQTAITLQIGSLHDEAVKGKLRQSLIREIRPRFMMDLFDTMLSDLRREKLRISEKDPLDSRVSQLEADMALIGQEIKECRRFVDEENRLTAEIRTRLSRAGLSIKEPGPNGQFAQTMSGTWQRPQFQDASKSGMVGSTHILLTEIRKPEYQGRYQISMRLVDLAKSRILWEEQGDRFDLSKQAVEFASPAFMMNTGEACLVRFANDVLPYPIEQTKGLMGGWPLRLPDPDPSLPPQMAEAEAKKKEAAATAARKSAIARRSTNSQQRLSQPEELPDGLTVLLGYREGEFGNDGYRDLFGWNVKPLDKLMLKRADGGRVPLPPGTIIWTPISSPSEVPDAHMMRYVVWRLARAILPTAGRVQAVNGSEVKLDLGRDHGVKVSDVLTVLRPGDPNAQAARSALTVVPVKLILREVHESGSTAIIDETDTRKRAPGLPALSVPRPGDLVHRVLDREIQVAVFNPDVELKSITPDLVRQYGEEAIRAQMSYVGTRTADLIQSALISQRVKVVDRKDLETINSEQKLAASDPHAATQVGRIKNASHVIVGTIAPSPRLNYRAPITLKVVDVTSAQVVAQIDFECTIQQVQKWRP